MGANQEDTLKMLSQLGFKWQAMHPIKAQLPFATARDNADFLPEIVVGADPLEDACLVI